MSAGSKQRSNEQERRQARLAEQLRANLQRRKAQARSRRSGDPDQRPDGLDAASAKNPESGNESS
ncbi:hypothetical protein [Oryzicola mucosus]|uniref:Uncharacterized protein n=1 Tax=Oryzicola mucosus TaxID=2767425 RepID=A0A8J6U3P7_9HYPH|nr:hypothetical protein [Oryzicola mucosus]MBD0413110.1 hypothetical protein [Oryzicola mucosus]